MVLANYMSPCNSIVGLYLKVTCDVINYHGNAKVHKKRPLNFSFVNYLKNLFVDLPFSFLCQKVP